MRFAIPWSRQRRTVPVRRRALLAAGLLSLPLTLASDQQAWPTPGREAMPSCFASGPVLWREAGGRSLLCTPATSAASVRPGGPCWRVYLHPVTFVVGPAGAVDARFAVADGATDGTLPVGVMPHHEAFVADARLGSDEATSSSAPTCQLASTLHFYCPKSGALDHLCLTWRGLDPGPGVGRAACGNRARWPPLPGSSTPAGTRPQRAAPGPTP